MNKILVAMSGGVDSSVCAKLLIDQGYTCTGCTMELFEKLNKQDVEDAQLIANSLGIDFRVLNYQNDFKEKVIDTFIKEYQIGHTPNPCIECNRNLKFGKILDEAYALGYDGIATGHYGRIVFEDGEYKLKKALDLSKDQSYVLYQMTQEQLAHTLFPLGEMTKDEARAIAEDNGFVNAHKKDSQDICFVPDGDYASVIEKYTGTSPKPGDFVDMDGNVLGQHKGIIHYTYGQRKGLGISAPTPLYVVKIDVEKNQVILGQNDDLFSEELIIDNFHWISAKDIPAEFDCSAKVRYAMKEQACHVEYLGDNKAKISFLQAQRAITPGQTAVLYDGDTVLGGGTII